jgi:hypothetical protein
MDKDNLIQNTIKLYKKTLLFPKKEPLRYKLREVADEILSDFVSLDISNRPNPGTGKNREEIIYNLEKNLEIINSYFDIAKWQNWVSYFDILEIQEEYAKMLSKLKIEAIQGEFVRKIAILAEKQPEKPEEIKKVLDSKPSIVRISEVKEKSDLDQRKQKILEVLKKKEKMQVWEANEIFPKVSKRTIRRDFVELLKRGLIERVGERNDTFYKLIS